ncbi:MAG: amino acid permease [Candidatus Thermoplasmatota archaeon]|nr:amino acid permease [Candidatus Thermoplasmatota archaeon]
MSKNSQNSKKVSSSKIDKARKRKILKRKKLRRERILLQLIRRKTKITKFRISTTKVEKRKISSVEGLAILIGTLVGAGVLGLPYAASKVGLIPSIGILFSVMLLMLFTAFIVLKLSAERGGAQMSTIAQNALGNAGGWVMYVSIMIMGFGAFLAYISGIGSIFTNLLGINEIFGALLFWAVASIVIYSGLEASGKTELIMNLLLLALFIGVTGMLVPYAKLENALYMDLGGVFSMIGVVIFAFGFHTVIPDVYRGLGSYEKTKKVVVLAFLIPTIVYAVFMIIFLMTFGKNTPQVATQGLRTIYNELGNIVGNALPLVAITTSYIGLGLAQQSNSKEFLGLKKPVSWALTVGPPVVIYLAGVRNFADVLSFVGNTGNLMAFILLPILILIIRRFFR